MFTTALQKDKSNPVLIIMHRKLDMMYYNNQTINDIESVGRPYLTSGIALYIYIYIYIYSIILEFSVFENIAIS